MRDVDLTIMGVTADARIRPLDRSSRGFRRDWLSRDSEKTTISDQNPSAWLSTCCCRSHHHSYHAVTTTTTTCIHKLITGRRLTPSEVTAGPRILPAVVPAAIVAATGDWRLLTLDINLNRMPSRAMAKRMRGRGNMQPSRLERRSFMVKFRSQWKTNIHDTSTVKGPEFSRSSMSQL